MQKIIIYKKTDNEEIMTREFINFGENEKKIKQCVEYISDLLNAECNYSINENEKTFLMIHLLRLCQKDL